MSGFVDRVVRAARLDPSVYEEVEQDRGAMPAALAVVVLSSLAGGIGAAGAGAGVKGLVVGALAAIVAWVIWSFLILLVGTKLLATPETHADLGQVLRTLGFAAGPGILQVLAVVPGLAWVVRIVAQVWMLAAMVVAVRQALDFQSTGRAVAVCIVGWLVQLTLSILALGLLRGAGISP